MNDKCIKRLEVAGHGESVGIETTSDGDEGLALLNGMVVYSDDERINFADSVSSKMADCGEILLNGCNTADDWKFGIMFNQNGRLLSVTSERHNISQALSKELPDVQVTGNRGFAVGNGLSIPGKRDSSFRIGKEDFVIGFQRTYKNGLKQ
jgi:hypothetical protein